jgi:hypothetical protein
VCAQTCAAHAVLAHNVRRTLNPAHAMLTLGRLCLNKWSNNK